MTNAFTTRIDGPAPELDVSKDMSRRGIILAPAVIAVCAVIWGADGAWSSAYGVALVLVNFLLAAGLIAATARISLAAMLGGVLFGYLLRLGLIFLAVWLVRDAVVDFAARARGDHNRHAPRAAGVGAEVRGVVAHVPGPQAGPRSTAPAPTDTDRTITTSPPTT